MTAKLHLPALRILQDRNLSHNYARCTTWTRIASIDETAFLEAPVEARCKSCNRISEAAQR